MSIKLSIVGGPLDGKVLNFPSTKTQITIGRLPDRDVTFPPDMNTISRAHATIVMENARYFIRPDEPVFIDGQEAVRDDPVPPSCTLALGAPGGQKIKVEWQSTLTVPKTVDPGRPKVRRNAARQAEEAARAAKSASRRLVYVAAAVGALAVAGIAAFFLTQETPIEARLQEARKSVYLVTIQLPDGREVGGGTSWVIGRATLGTNAHVIEDFAETKAKGAKWFVRSPEPPYKAYEIQSVQEHPHYRAFNKATAAWLPIRNKELVNFVSGYDVALIKVASDADLAAPLKLADDATIKALAAGEIVGYVGYPMERMTGGGTDLKAPNPQTQVGRVTAVTDYFMVRQDAEHNYLVQQNLGLTGGASGSPMFNRHGEVVGLISAMNIAVVTRGDDQFRIPLAAGVNFSQRGDLIVELMDGSAAGKSAERSLVWQRGLSGYDHGPDVVVRELLERLKSPDTKPLLDQTLATASPGAGKPAEATVNFSTAAAGTLVAVVFGPEAGKLHFYVSQQSTPDQPFIRYERDQNVPYGGASLNQPIQGRVLLRTEKPAPVRVRLLLVPAQR